MQSGQSHNMASKKDKLTDEDINLFRSAVKNTTPLRQKNRKIELPKTTTKTKKTPVREHNSSDDSLINEFDIKTEISQEVTAADILIFSRPGPQNKLLRKLRRGQFEIEAELDLHGMRVKDASAEITAFLNHSLSSGYRCVKVIHGKGRGAKSELPILKNKVNTWLRQIPQVMAFCSAQPNDGGIGAVYILLKRL